MHPTRSKGTRSAGETVARQMLNGIKETNLMAKLRTVVGGAALVVWLLTPLVAVAQDHAGHNAHAQEKADDYSDAEGAKLPLRPVMGDAVDSSIKTMTDDGPVYFCCKSCVKKVAKGLEKYADKIAAERAALDKRQRVQVNCLVSGTPIDGRTFAMIDGQGVSFCYERCVAEYEKSLARFRAKLADSYTYQARCPVGNETIDPTSYVDPPTKQRIYLCCDGCAAKLLKNPQKYAENLAAQGVRMDVQKREAPKSREHHAVHAHEHP